jgi:uncharacterized membrane protein
MQQAHHHTQNKEVQEGKFFAVISYISFLCVITLLLKKNNKFALFHAKQGLVIFVVEVVSFVLSIIPLLGMMIKIVGFTFCAIASLWGVLQSFSGICGKIPLVSRVSDKISL